jgi:hypothetical protein
MDEIITVMKETLPAWLVGVIMLMIGVVRYGPKFIRSVKETAEEMRGKDGKYADEYVAMLKEERDRLLKKVEDLERKLDDRE